MTDDIRIKHSLVGHPKLERLKILIGDQAFERLVTFWVRVSQNRPKGNLTDLDEIDIALYAGWQGDPKEFLDAMIKCKFIKDNGRGLEVQDWEEHQPWVYRSKERSEMARKAALARWQSDPDPEDMQDVCVPHTERNAPLLTSPLPSKCIDTSVSIHSSEHSVPPCPQKEIINLYHENLPSLTHIKVWTRAYQDHLRARWREDPERQSLEFWENLFKYISESDFLMGKVRDWSADLSWIVKADNFAKILNGRYHQKTGVKLKPTTYRQAQDAEGRAMARWVIERQREKQGDGATRQIPDKSP